MSGISTRNSACWRTRLKQCMDERGLTQLDFVRALNRQYLTKFHQKDVSRWLNTGNRTSSGEIGFPKYETMATIADFFGVDVGYLTGETDEKTYAMSHACAFTGLSSSSIAAVRSWIGTPRAPQKNNHTHDGDPMPEYRAATMKVYDKLGETYKQNLPIEQARAQAKRLALQLDDQVQREIEKSNETAAQIAAAKAEATALIDTAAA